MQVISDIVLKLTYLFNKSMKDEGGRNQITFFIEILILIPYGKFRMEINENFFP